MEGDNNGNDSNSLPPSSELNVATATDAGWHVSNSPNRNVDAFLKDANMMTVATVMMIIWRSPECFIGAQVEVCLSPVVE